MRVDELRLDPWGGGREFSGRVRFDRAGLEPQRVWFRSPLAPEGELDASPFLPALLLLSMWLGEPLAIDGPVSPRLLGNVERASLVLRSWWPGLQPARVEAAEAKVPPGEGGDVGVFFTRGVDSWYTVLETVREQPACLRLLGWTGGDLESLSDQSPERDRAATAELERAAGRVPGELDLMESNLRRVVEPHVAWEWTHGGLLSALALAHGGLGEARIASTRVMGRLVSLGSHPLLDPLWSTEAVRLVHHGAEVTRMEKVAVLATRPDVLATLRFCEYSDPHTNCGACDKCVKTMLGLELAGAPRVVPLEASLSRARMARVAVSTSLQRLSTEEALAAAGRERRFDLSDPLQIAFGRDHARRARKRLWVVLRRRLRRPIDRLWSRAG